MAIPIRIKRGQGVPATLLRGELAYDEIDRRLFIGEGTSGNDAEGRPIASVVRDITPATVALSDLGDVDVAGATDGDVLSYDSSSSSWVAQAAAAATVAWGDITSKPASFPPDTHASSHHTGGGDAIAPADIGAAAATHTHSASDITSGLAAVATTGAYSDLSGTPTLATVATTGAYSDLSGTPTLGTAAASATTDFVAASAISSFGENLLSEESAESARTTLGLGSAATSATSAFAAASHSHAWGDITSGVPSSFTPSAHSHTVTLEISGFIEEPEAKTYIISPSLPAAITITQFHAQTSAGTVDLAVHDDGTLVTGCSLADAGTTLASLASAISESVAAGSKLALVVSDLQSSPADLAFTIHYTVASANNA